MMLSRRTFLRASGVAVSVPFLESMHSTAFAAPVAPKRRMVAINIGLGLHGPNMIPEDEGRDYKLSTYLKQLEKHRDQFTMFSGVSHPDVGGGHYSGKSFLTAAKNPNSAGFKNTISLDQFAAELLGTETRFGSLALSSSGRGLSWSRSGVEVPSEQRPSRVFEQLFLEGNPQEKALQKQRLQDGQSVLDVVADRAKHMEQRLARRDREKLDQYFEAVRETEKRLVKAQEWESRPKPVVDAEPPKDELDHTKLVEQQHLMYDMMHLALQTDSTRFITYNFSGFNAVPTIPGIDTDYHMLSHHGRDEEKIAQLTIVETEIMKCLNYFLDKLVGSQEDGGNLLDQTMVLFGSNLGNASSHDAKNMPIVLAGGGFKHGQHLKFDAENNYPLPNLFVSMLQRLGLEVDQFASGTTTMTGLEMI